MITLHTHTPHKQNHGYIHLPDPIQATRHNLDQNMLEKDYKAMGCTKKDGWTSFKFFLIWHTSKREQWDSSSQEMLIYSLAQFQHKAETPMGLVKLTMVC